MPSPSKLAEALAATAPAAAAAYPTQLRAAVASGAATATEEEQDPDSDEESDRIIAKFRAKQEAIRQQQEELRRVEEDALASVLPIQAHWGPAAKAAHLRNALAKADMARGAKLSSIRAAAAAALAAKNKSGEVLTDPDFLMLFHGVREAALMGTVPKEAEMHAFAATAACVCRAWNDACRAVLLRRAVLRPSYMFVAAPDVRAVAHFCRPSFIDISSNDELVVAHNHNLVVFQTPPVTSSDRNSSGGSSGGGSGGGGGGSGQGSAVSRVDRPGIQAALARRVIGRQDGAGGSVPGELTCTLMHLPTCPYPHVHALTNLSGRMTCQRAVAHAHAQASCTTHMAWPSRSIAAPYMSPIDRITAFSC